MSDPEERKEWERRGREGLGNPSTGEPKDWESREAYRRGAEEREASEQSRQHWNDYYGSLFKSSDAGAGQSNFNVLGCLAAIWFLAYYGLGALVVSSLLQSGVKAVTGAGIAELIAAVGGFIGGIFLIGWAFASNGLFRRLYAGVIGIGFPLLFAAGMLFGSFQSTPILQRLGAIAILTLLIGGSSWLTFRFIDRRASA